MPDKKKNYQYIVLEHRDDFKTTVGKVVVEATMAAAVQVYNRQPKKTQDNIATGILALGLAFIFSSLLK